MNGITSLLNQTLGHNPVERMSNENAIGENTGYPMAYMQTPSYAVPRNTPQPQDVIHGGQDANVDPYTGQEKFCGGGIVALNAGGMPTDIDGGMTFADGGVTPSPTGDFSSQGILDFLLGRSSQQPRYSQMRTAPVVGSQMYDQSGKALPRYQVNPDGTISLAGAQEAAQQALGPTVRPSSGSGYNPESFGTSNYVSPQAMRAAVLASGDQAGENYSHEGLTSIPRAPTFAEGIGNLAKFLMPGSFIPAIIGNKNDYGSIASNLNTMFGSRPAGDVAPIEDRSGTPDNPPGTPVEGPAPGSTPYTPVYADTRNATEAVYTPSGSVDAYSLSGWGGGDGGESSGSKAGGLMHEMAHGGLSSLHYNLGSYSDGGRLLKGPGDGVSDDIPATIGASQPARLADGEFVVPARIVSELGNGSTDAGARKLYAMMDRIQHARKQTMGKGKEFAKDTKADKYLPK